jgi:hypothetical protein
MSTLEVLQSCPTQQKALLKDIGGIDPTDTNLIVFNLEDHIPRLPPQLAFQIQVVVSDKNICRTVIDEGASTCVMSFSCWKAIGSPPLNESQNNLKAFNGSGFKPYSVLPLLPITLEGKTVQFEVEVFDAPLDYNLLLGHSWIDSMRAVVSTLFRVVCFPHQGKVVIVDQLAFFNSNTRTGNVSFIAKTPSGYENVGVGLLKDSSLMDTFPIPLLDVPRPSVASIKMISSVPHELPVSSDPWIVLDPRDHTRFGDVMTLSLIESAYQAIPSATPSTPSLDELSLDPFRVIFPTDEMIMSSTERRRIRSQACHYIILRDTLYCRGIDSIFRCCLTFDEAEKAMNDYHSGACGGHMSGYATAQKILRAGYFWPSLFNDCITAIQKCHACQTYNKKIWSHPAPLHPVVSVGPFAKWGIDFMTCHPHSVGGHGYIIVAVDYFTKWAEAMPTFDNTGKTATLFLFNHVIARFGVPQAIVTNHGSHFRNLMMYELTEKLGLRHDNSTPYYPQANGQVKEINKVFITMLRRMIGIHKTSWHTMLFPTLWEYWTFVKSSTGFTHFRLVYGVESILPIECEIPSLKLAVELLPNTSAEEERLLYLMRLDETRCDATLIIEA